MDSVINKYLRQGAWKYPIFSAEWNEYIDSGLLAYPECAYLWQQKAMPFFKQMKYELGMTFLDSAVKYDARKWLDYRAFIKCIFQKNYAGSLQDFAAAKLLRSGAGTVMDHPYDFFIALCHLQLDHLDSASTAMSACPNDDYLHCFYKGIILYEQRKYVNAIADLDRSLGLYSGFSDAKFYKGLCLTGLHRYEEALALLRTAKQDLSQGATINEGNSKYEKYPYQVSMDLIDFYLKWTRSLSLANQ